MCASVQSPSSTSRIRCGTSARGSNCTDPPHARLDWVRYDYRQRACAGGTECLETSCALFWQDTTVTITMKTY